MERLGLSLRTTPELSIPNVIRLVQIAEDCGYESVWVPETWGDDAITVLAALACNTSRIGLASGVLNVFSRSAALIAQSAATLQELSNGRFILGLGTSGPRVIERWHGMPYHDPLARTEEYIAVIRMALAGSPVDFEGSGYRLGGFRLLNPPNQPVPIYVAAIGPRNLQLTGRIADGWLPIFPVRGKVRALVDQLNEAASERKTTIDVAAYVPALISRRGEALLREQVAYYVGGMGSYYNSMISRSGFPTEAQQIKTLWQVGNRASAAAAVSEKLLSACTVGTEKEHGTQRLADYRSEGIGLPVLTFPHVATRAEVEATLLALAPGK
ncbi:MAG: TIGR04024 family LLM class F420-dependent oxidoreductase [Chloroflexota bacterium]